MALLRLSRGNVSINVFGHDDAHVTDITDGDRQSCERHNVRIDAEPIHRDERTGDRQRERQHRCHRAAQMQQECDDDQRAQQRFFTQRLLQRIDGLMDDVGAIIERHHMYA